MLKEMIQFEDIDGQTVTRTVMFNLTQFEIEGEIELEILQDRFQKFQDEVIGDDPNAPIREMTGPEKREILGLIKDIVRHSYGIKDGKRFKKSQEIWDEFEQTGAFSAFIYHLFEKPERANNFMMGIWPQGVDRPDERPSPDLKVISAETPSEISDNDGNFLDSPEDYAPHVLLNMTDAEFDAVVKHFSNGKNVPLSLLQIGMQRNRGGSPE